MTARIRRARAVWIGILVALALPLTSAAQETPPQESIGPLLLGLDDQSLAWFVAGHISGYNAAANIFLWGRAVGAFDGVGIEDIGLPRTPLHADQIAAIVREYTENHPEKWHLEASVIIQLALENAGYHPLLTELRAVSARYDSLIPEQQEVYQILAQEGYVPAAKGAN